MTTGPAPSGSISGKIVKNTAYNMLGKLWWIAIAIFLTPYIVSKIGIDRFGVWAIVGVITGYFGLLDFGIGMSFVKYIAEFHTKGENNKIDRLIDTGFTLYTIFALFCLVVVFILRGPILHLLSVPAYLHHEAGIVLLIGIALFGASNAMSPFLAVQGGLQRMDISNKIGIGLSILNIAGTIYFLEHGFGIIGLMINNVIVFTVMAIINVFVAHRLVPAIRFRGFHFDLSIFRKLFGFGYNMQIAKISGQISAQTDKILISCFLSIGLVTFYQLGSSIVYNACSFAYVLSSALMPAFSEIDARGERSRLVEAYLRSVKYLSFFTVPVFVFMAISAGQIMFIWMGFGYGQSVFVIQILAFALLVYTLAQSSSSVSAAIGKPQLLATGSLIIIVLNLTLSAIFIKVFGFLGAAWGTLIAVNVGTIYFLDKLHKDINVTARDYFGSTIPFFLACAAASCVVLLLWNAIGRFSDISNLSRLWSLALFFVRGIVFLLAYLICVKALSPFKASELGVIKEKIPVFGPVMVKIISRS